MTSPPTANAIAPVLILSTGRCGSTMISDLLNRHPRVLSLSEFFVTLGPAAFASAHLDGEAMWRILSTQGSGMRAMLREGHVVEECLYPFGAPGARHSLANVPPISTVTLPHLTDQPDALFDKLEPRVRARPRLPLADQYRALFGDLAREFGRDVWVERSGGSLMHTAKLLRLFPEARVIHVYRDGRDTAMSMSRHRNFRILVGVMRRCLAMGIDFRRTFHVDRGGWPDLLAGWLVFKLFDVEKLAAQPDLPDFGRFWSDMIAYSDVHLRQLPADRLLNVKFEDVQNNPREHLTRLIRFIDPALEDQAWLDAVSAIPRPARSSYSRLSADEQAALTSACLPGLTRLGYQP